MKILKAANNPLFKDEIPALDPDQIGGKGALVYRKTGAKKKEIRKLTRKETAAEAVAGIVPGLDIFGFTKGQFSLIELIEVLVDTMGPCTLQCSTWTAANADLSDILRLLQSGKLLDVRILLDFSFQRRQPQVAKEIREKFGHDAIRITRNHAKFFLLDNRQGWRLTGKTSMNLNTNPRFEDFDLCHDDNLYQFLEGMLDETWKKSRKDQGEMSVNQLWREWQDSR